ncbi:hypothetical protein [Salinigranum salinum]|uniref:hypothetical protein n=1 Tax=Salinigranum salinum TaxID=1364937 RepID=UPI00126096D7|nr:hypothetical protein [Salinigranum salinum]
MRLSRRLTGRLIRLFVRWGLIKHPYGREYAREQYTLTGRRVQDAESSRDAQRVTTRVTPRVGAALMAMALLLLSFLAAGVLIASG